MANWFNTKSIGFIWHGEWADPELESGGKVVNYFDVEYYVVDCMKEENLNYNDDEIFGNYVREHETDIICFIDEIAPNIENEEIEDAA